MSIHKPLPHDAAPLHVTGEARYVDDIPTPAGTLHLAFGLSTVAHGDITALDLTAVRAAPGVVAVLTGADIGHADCSPSNNDEPLLALGSVHYVGQPVFLVVADSHLAARKAARLGKIAYDEKPAILTYEDAITGMPTELPADRIAAPQHAVAQVRRRRGRAAGGGLRGAARG